MTGADGPSADVASAHRATGVHFGQTGGQNERWVASGASAEGGGQGAVDTSGLRALFAPRAIAVIGASASPGKLGAAMARSLASFPGPVLLVNDRRPDPAVSPDGVAHSPAVAALADGQGGH